MNQRVVTLRNAAGQALHCILEEPPAGVVRSNVACLLLSPGVKMRVAPHRLYRKLAPEFLQRGMAVLRVDFHGLGDSEGELTETQLDQLYRQVQLGRHVGDVHAALSWLARELGVAKFVVGGLCGGALTGLLAAQAAPGVVALYGIGIPVTLDGSGRHASEIMTKGQLGEMRKSYLGKILRPAAWLRLLTFRSDWRTIVRSVLASRQQKRAVQAQPAAGGAPQPEGVAAADLNHGFVEALFGLLRTNRKALLLFSGSDRLHFEYNEKFATPWRAALQQFTRQLRVLVIARANHVLGSPVWVSEARAETGKWLDQEVLASGTQEP
jgi:uncharacterized protein